MGYISYMKTDVAQQEGRRKMLSRIVMTYRIT